MPGFTARFGPHDTVRTLGVFVLVLAACPSHEPPSMATSSSSTEEGSSESTSPAIDLPQPQPSSETTGSSGESSSIGEDGSESTTTGPVVDPEDDERLFVPENLPNTLREGLGEVALELVAFTLANGESGPELAGAVRNNGDVPACYGGMFTYFMDETDTLVAMAASSLVSRSFYRIDDGTDVIVSCLAPGEIAMTAAQDLPDTVVIEELAYLEHEFPLFELDALVPVDIVTVSDVTRVERDGGRAYTGTITNVWGDVVRNPTAVVFPVNRVGRPLGVTTIAEEATIPANEQWTFETPIIANAGVDAVVFASAEAPSE